MSLSTIRRRAPGLSPLAVDLSPAAVLCFALPPTDPNAVDLELTIESVMRAGGALCHFDASQLRAGYAVQPADPWYAPELLDAQSTAERPALEPCLVHRTSELAAQFDRLGQVWAWAALVWELFNAADLNDSWQQLYPSGKPAGCSGHLSNSVLFAGADTEQVFGKLELGCRLPCPRKCPQEWYHLMLQCWEVTQCWKERRLHLRLTYLEHLSN